VGAGVMRQNGLLGMLSRVMLRGLVGGLTHNLTRRPLTLPKPRPGASTSPRTRWPLGVCTLRDRYS
jgi:hypothetical protein